VGVEAVLPFEEALEWCLQGNIALDEDDRSLLHRWSDDDRASKAWSTIRAHSEQHDGAIGLDAPIHFIIFILQMKKLAEEESRLNAAGVRETTKLSKLRAQVTGEVARAAKKVPFENRGKFLECTGKRLQLPSIHISAPGLRSDQKGSRARTYFIRAVSALVHDLTGRWLDEQVASITEIAFDKADIDTEAIRSARRRKA
jgi:hypothetical protein